MRIIVERWFEDVTGKDTWLRKLSGDPSMGNIKQEILNGYHKVIVESFHDWVNTKLLYPDAVVATMEVSADKWRQKPAVRKGKVAKTAKTDKKKVLDKG